MKLRLQLHTIRYLKLKQILFRMYYAYRRALRRLLGSQYRYFIEKFSANATPFGTCTWTLTRYVGFLCTFHCRLSVHECNIFIST